MMREVTLASINLSVSGNILQNVQDATTMKEAWDAIIDFYETKIDARKEADFNDDVERVHNRHRLDVDSESDDDFDAINKVTDTTAAQARRGKDIQGIHWDRLNFTRAKYRETRLQQYKNYENLPRRRHDLAKVIQAAFCAGEEIMANLLSELERFEQEMKELVSNSQSPPSSSTINNASTTLGFASSSEVVRDKRTGKTRGYGFVSFSSPSDLALALKEMNGKYVGNRPIKLRKSNWKERTDSEAWEKQRMQNHKKGKSSKKNVLHK